MNNSDIVDSYSSSQDGGELPYFVGKQYFSGWLKTIGRFAMPLLKRLGRIGMKTAKDVIMNDAKILPSLKANALSNFQDVIPKFNSMLGNTQTIRKRKKTKSRSNINKRYKGNGTIFE